MAIQCNLPIMSGEEDLQHNSGSYITSNKKKILCMYVFIYSYIHAVCIHMHAYVCMCMHIYAHTSTCITCMQYMIYTAFLYSDIVLSQKYTLPSTRFCLCTIEDATESIKFSSMHYQFLCSQF